MRPLGLLLWLAWLAGVAIAPAIAQACSNTGGVADVAAIQALLNNAAMTTICLPAQTYSITTVLTVSRSVNIVGTNTVFNLGASTARFITISANLPLVSISGIRFNAQSSTYSFESKGRVMYVDSGTRLVWRNSVVLDALMYYGGALYLNTGASVEGTGLSFTGCGGVSGYAAYWYGGVAYLMTTASFSCTGCNFQDGYLAGASSLGAVFYLASPSYVRLYNSTITGNQGSNNAGVAYLENDSVFEAFNSTITGNRVDPMGGGEGFGGVLYAVDRADIWFQDCTVTSNLAAATGGVIYAGVSANITILRSTFTSNKATNADAGILFVGNGAGIIIDSSTFTSNTAGTDAGVIRTGTTAQITVTSSTFSQNSASRAGGVFLLEGTNSAVVAYDTLFDSNQAISGGVLDMISSNTLRASFFRCNFTANMLSSESGTGGTVFRVRNNQIVVVDTTLTGNVRASITNNVGMIQVDSTGRVGVVNSQLSGNSGTKQFDALLASATLLTLGANIAPSGTTMINEPNLAAYCIDCQAIAPFLCTAVPACAFVSSSRVMTPTSLLSSATPSSATPSSATPSVTPSSATPSSATPSSATPSVTPSSATPSVTPSSAPPSVAPSSATPLSATWELSISVASTAAASTASAVSSIAHFSVGSQASSSTAAIAGAVASVAVVAIIAVVLIVLRRRRSHRSSVARPKDSAKDSTGPIYQEAVEMTISPLPHANRSHKEDDSSVYDVVGQQKSDPVYAASSIPSTEVVYDDASVYAVGSNSRRIRDGLTIVKHLASGNFGDVALGQVPFNVLPSRAQNLLGPATPETVQVAVKSLKSDVDEKSRKDFESEAKLMAPFVHPNVVRLLAALVESEPNLLLLEFVQYGDLRTLLRKSKVHSLWWTQNEQIHAIRQIALGMEYLGTLHFVHRDLAARNCLVGQGMVVKIADFGLTRELDNGADYYRIQTRGKLPAKWMAPETLNFRKFSSMSDVWSFGVTAWECSSYGATPYGEMDGRETLAHVEAGGRLPMPDTCVPELYNMMMSCWNVMPDFRPSFSQLAKGLTSLQDGSTVREIGAML
ncbi:non-receptor protein kinase [Capsaspora owczarzaki ATCC 30864]|uniref:TKL protein kinase n=1 Tax=Capsaspora owczarzaki (strain ATCC 30864) TaxID=595528 RepID=A0A0D2WS14_CAPO3|nr:non-receptor protein kinase [Capsaspora owczarzaki ATCC 30864]KJE94123.1 TKL protein kinase [Capsaspora owczarzaki ATCC 30864]|eukprot:XP_004347562.1 non-receptor protein kinase [Capsaspora owczarzaki ATCC 30864]